MTNSVRQFFSKAAPQYDEGADIQRRAASKLMDLISHSTHPHRIADLGCGSGQLTRLLSSRWACTPIQAVDVAEGMIAAGRRLIPRNEFITWTTADITRWHADQPFDLVTSNCALHWLHPLEDGLRHVAGLVTRGGTLACSLMLHGTLNELHAARLRAAPHKPPEARMPSLEFVESVWSQSGLTITHAASEQRVSHATAVSEIFQSLRRLGLTGGALSRGRAPLTRQELRRLEELYERKPDGTFAMTYHIGYIIAEKL